MRMDTDDLTHRLTRLGDDVGAYKAQDPCPWAIGQTFNALLAAAKESSPDDPVLKAIEPLEVSSAGQYVAGPTCGAVKALCMQVVASI